MSGTLTPVERRLLAELASREDPAERSPAALSLALGTDLRTVLETVDALHDRGLLEREGFDTCRLTDRGREVATGDP